MDKHKVKEQEMRIHIIRSINHDLVYHGCEPIETDTFDILYDYDIDELLIARDDIHAQIREIMRYNRPKLVK